MGSRFDAMTPADRLLASVDWKPLPPQAPDPSGIPHATHEGFLRIAGGELHVFQLSDGRRIITEESLVKFFGGGE